MKVHNPTKTIFEFRGNSKRCILFEENISPDRLIQYFRDKGASIQATDITGEWYVRLGDEFPKNIVVEMWVTPDNIGKLFDEKNAKQLYEITRFKKIPTQQI